MAIGAYRAWGLIPAVIIGFFFIFGLGWKALGFLYTLLKTVCQSIFFPRRARYSKEFIAAWEAKFGEIRMGRKETYPPPGAFQQWYRVYKNSGVTPGEWLNLE
jgi:hypothetical protein